MVKFMTFAYYLITDRIDGMKENLVSFRLLALARPMKGLVNLHAFEVFILLELSAGFEQKNPTSTGELLRTDTSLILPPL